MSLATLVALATRASHRTRSRRQEAARRKYVGMLGQCGGVISTQILKDRLGLAFPHQAIRQMEKYGLIRKVRHIPQHWEYEVIEETAP